MVFHARKSSSLGFRESNAKTPKLWSQPRRPTDCSTRRWSDRATRAGRKPDHPKRTRGSKPLSQGVKPVRSRDRTGRKPLRSDGPGAQLRLANPLHFVHRRSQSRAYQDDDGPRRGPAAHAPPKRVRPRGRRRHGERPRARAGPASFAPPNNCVRPIPVGEA